LKPNLPTGNLVKNKYFKNISKDSAFWFVKKTFSTPKQNQRELGKDKKPADSAICKDKPKSEER
jgi:hypothetical protein